MGFMQQLIQKILQEKLAKTKPQVEQQTHKQQPATSKDIQNKTAALQCDKMLNSILPTEKPKKRQRQTWKTGYKLCSLTYPTQCQRNGSRKRFQVELRFKDENNKKHKKTILFGKPAIKEYIDNLDQMQRLHRCVQLKHTQDLFHPNHWRLHMLNTRKSLSQAYTAYLNNVDLA